jgi:hypothetical protein
MASKRELIDTGRDKRFVRRDQKGQFKESDDVGRSLSQDVRRKAKAVVMLDTAIRTISVATNSGAIVLLWQTSRDSSSAKPSSPNVSP